MEKINEKKLQFKKRTVLVLTDLKAIKGGVYDDTKNTIEITISKQGSSGKCA
ncbi:MAG: hypothetical protein QM535_19085 [Limnohabitans sp.]|nr:hypothetical protein [Limnohabitans sp.]